jgi:hypothetical protein
MPADRTKLIAIVGLGVLLCILGCTGMITLLNKVEEDSSQSPIRRLRITLDESQRDELFDHLKKFADYHTLKFTLSDYGTGDNFLVEILGDDIKILAVISRPDPEIVSIGFYSRSPESPPPDAEFIDDLLNDLKGFLSEIPNVTISEQK